MNDIDKENTFIMIVCKKWINLKYLSVKNVKSFAFKIGGSEGIPNLYLLYIQACRYNTQRYIHNVIYLFTRIASHYQSRLDQQMLPFHMISKLRVETCFPQFPSAFQGDFSLKCKQINFVYQVVPWPFGSKRMVNKTRLKLYLSYASRVAQILF